MVDLNDLTLDPFNLGSSWSGDYISVDGTTETGPIIAENVEEVLYHGVQGDEWDGKEAVVFKMKDGRFVAYETFYGPTGNGFNEDAYGGDADLFFSTNLKFLILMALTDEGRRLCGIPVEGL